MAVMQEQIGRRTLSRMASGERGIGRFCKVDSTDGVEYASLIDEATVDESRMAVGPVTISTPAIDRVGDILIPSGCRIDDYKTNPVILWEHGFSGEDGGSMPIASAEDSNGNLSVEITDEFVKSWAYFNGKTLLSDQVFGLVAAKAIRATSVRPTPINASLIEHEDGTVGLRMDEWSMSEWSFVGIGCNQEALVKAARDRRWQGKRLAAPLLKTFSPLAVKKAMGIGMSLKKTTPKTATKTDPVDEEEVKNDDGEVVEEQEAEPDGKGDEPVDDVQIKDDSEPDGDEPAAKKYGAQYLTATYAALKALVDNMQAGLGPNENEDVRTLASDMIDDLSSKMMSVDGLYSSVYNDQGPIKAEGDDTGHEEPDGDEEALKSFLSAGILNRTRCGGIANVLKSVVGAKNLTPQQKLSLKTAFDGLVRLEREAKTHTKTALEKKVEQVATMYADLKAKFDRMTPHERSA